MVSPSINKITKDYIIKDKQIFIKTLTGKTIIEAESIF